MITKKNKFYKNAATNVNINNEVKQLTTNEISALQPYSNQHHPINVEQ